MPINIKATREGLEGQKTYSGWRINSSVNFVALPSLAAVRQSVIVTYNHKSCRALVLDVGPWNIDDDSYVFGNTRPQAETGTDKSGRKTNHAGIDLGEAVRNELGIVEDNVVVDWKFSWDL